MVLLLEGPKTLCFSKRTHWQHGQAEAKIDVLTEMTVKVSKDMEVSDGVWLCLAMSHMSESNNRLVNRNGFCPSQGQWGIS